MFKDIEKLIDDKNKKVKFLKDGIERANKKIEILEADLKKALDEKNLDKYTEITVKINATNSFTKDIEKQVEEAEKEKAYSIDDLIAVKQKISSEYDPKFKKFEDKIFKNIDDLVKNYEEWKKVNEEAYKIEQELGRKGSLIGEEIKMERGDYAYKYKNIKHYHGINSLKITVENLRKHREGNK